MTDAAQPTATGVNLLPWIIVSIWFAVIVTIALNDGFVQNAPGLPSRLAIAFVLPVGLFALAYRLLAGVRNWVAGLDMALIVGVQTWRVLGMVFLFALGLGLLPATFAVPAGVGDTAVGIFALFVTLAVVRQAPGWQGRVKLLAFVGILDFAIAFSTATLSGEGRPLQIDGAPLPALMQSLPLILIPAFGVPLFLIAHLITLLKLRDA